MNARTGAYEPRIDDQADYEPRDASPVKIQARECTEQLDKLISLVVSLEDRLVDIRLPKTRNDPRANAPDEVAEASPLVSALRANVRTVKDIQRRIVELLDELEL